jgi:tetratricopeptide (TPR) repeat protein
MAAMPPLAELLNAGRVDEAIGSLQSHLRTSPEDAEAYALLTRAYFSLEHWDDAISAGQQAVLLAPNNSNYHLWLARAYGEKANHSNPFTAISCAKKTRAELERSVALDGGNIAARVDLSEYYASAPSFLGGGKDKARAQAEQIRRLGDEATPHWVNSKIAQNEKNYAVEEQELRAAIQVSKGKPDFIMNLAAFYLQRGRLNDAEAMVNQAVAAENRPHNLSLLYDGADTLFLSGRNFDGALTLLRSYVSAREHADEAPVFRAYYLMGLILEKIGNKTAAAEQYRTALQMARDFEPAQTALKRVR